MTFSKFIAYILGIGVLAVVAIFSANYVIDPYSVFGTKFFPEYGQLQERYLKIEYLKTHPEFNTFLIGGSRIGVIKTEIVDGYLPGAKTYNLTLSQARPIDIEKHVEWLERNIPNLSHVIVQLDWAGEYGPISPGYALMNESHPEISGRFKYGFLFNFLTFISIEALRVKVGNNNSEVIGSFKYDLGKGYWSHPFLDKKIEANCDEYVANEKSFSSDNIHPTKLNSELLAKGLSSIARIKGFLEKRNVKLTVFLTPINHHQIDSIDVKDYERFIRQLVKFTDFYNFMYYSKLTKNDCNYYEASHYRPVVGELIIRSLAEQPNNRGEIYRYVTKASVDTHIDFLKANYFLKE